MFVAYDTRIFQYAVHNNKSPVAMPSQKNAVHNINTKNRVSEMHMWSREPRNSRVLMLVSLFIKHVYVLDLVL